jgi:hypothetical protein
MFPAEINLATLLEANGGDGSVGFVQRGLEIGDAAGRAVSAAGDLNGDGIDDFCVGANGSGEGGRAYVVFGARDGFPPELDLGSLLARNGGDGTIGFAANWSEFSESIGSSVSGGEDFNADGVSDLVVGAQSADPSGFSSGRTYIIFGKTGGFPPELELASFLEANGGDGSQGFALNGALDGSRSGASVDIAGDVNGDGIPDVIIGAYEASPLGRQRAGETYVVFGSTEPFPAEFELAALDLAGGGDGTKGFVLKGAYTESWSGSSVSTAGDVNGDGLDDILIGGKFANPHGIVDAGQAYVVFGRNSGFPAEIDLLSLLPGHGGDGATGFVMNGIGEYDFAGYSVSGAGDVNGDGIDDLIVGALSARGEAPGSGASYVLFGRIGRFPPVFELRSLLPQAGGDGSRGFVLAGIAKKDSSGYAVGGAGDVNGDGIDDLIIGARTADPHGVETAGQTYVVFGRSSGFPPVFALSTLLESNGGDGTEGFALNGVEFEDASGTAVNFAGDVNGDGVDDIILGMHEWDAGSSPGESYVIFGRRDSDGDEVADNLDNCTLEPNPDQRDTNGDGYGNRCDPDLDDDGIVDFEDLGLFKSVFLSTDADADFDGDGVVNFTDLGITKAYFFRPPGPSGQVPVD